VYAGRPSLRDLRNDAEGLLHGERVRARAFEIELKMKGTGEAHTFNDSNAIAPMNNRTPCDCASVR